MANHDQALLGMYRIYAPAASLRQVIPSLPYCDSHPLPLGDGVVEFAVQTTTAGFFRLKHRFPVAAEADLEAYPETVLQHHLRNGGEVPVWLRH